MRRFPPQPRLALTLGVVGCTVGIWLGPAGCAKQADQANGPGPTKPDRDGDQDGDQSEGRNTDQDEKPGSPTAKTPADKDPRPIMTQQELLDKAKAYLIDDAGVADNVANTLSVNFRLLLSADGKSLGVAPEASVPFVFFQTQPVGGKRGRKGGKTERLALGGDATTGTIWYKNPDGFAAFVTAYGYHRTSGKQVIEARDLVTAWFILTQGDLPRITDSNAKHGKEIEMMVGPPSTEKKGDVLETIGWTTDERAWNLKKHTIRVFADGKVTAETVTAAELEEQLGK